MKELIFVNTSVQPESFCSIYLISTEQQMWLRGWAVSEQESAASCSLQTFLTSQGEQERPQSLLATLRCHQQKVSSPGTHLEEPKKEEEDHKRFMATGNFRFQRDGFLPHLCAQLPGSPNPTSLPWSYQKMERYSKAQEQVSWAVGPESLQCQIKEEIFNCRRSFASTLHMMSRKVQKNLFLFCRESGRRTSMFKCITAFFTALWTEALLQLKNICKLNFLGKFFPYIFSINSCSICF